MPSIDFKIERQLHSEWCWAAVASSVDHYYNPRSRWCQCRLASKMAKIVKIEVKSCGSCEDGKPFREVCNKPWDFDRALHLIRRLRGKPKPGPLSFAEISRTLSQQRPVCLAIDWGRGPREHCVVITGCETTGKRRWVDVQDPLYGNSTWLYEEFCSNYKYAQGRWACTFPV